MKTTLLRGLIMFAVATGLDATAHAQSREVGTITGRVVAAAGGAPLVGALVKVDGTSISTVADQAGAFRLIGVPPGERTLVVQFLGLADGKVEVNVTPNEQVDVPVKLSTLVVRESVTVTADSIQEGQSRALNQQRTALNIANVVAADQIGSFPDPNAAEAASRIPGVSIARDQGEGRYILVRGTEARLNSVMIDGERIPAAEGATRTVQLDAVPADQLQAIEVSKAVTPDMDADSIGGAVNLVTRQALARPMFLLSFAGGYNPLQRSRDQRQYSGAVGRRLLDGRVGLLVSFSGSELHRGSENFEAAYAAGLLSDLQLRDYQITRQRYGVNASVDLRLTTHTQLSFKSIFNEFKDYEVNNRLRYRPTNRRLEHVLKNRNQTDHIRSFSAGAQQLVRGVTTVDYKLAWAESNENQPDRLDTIFRQTNINFAPNVTATSIDPTNIQPNPSANNPTSARLNSWETEIFNTTDRDVTGAFNVRTPLRMTGNAVSFLKFGAKVKDKRKQRDFLAQVGTPVGTVLFPALQDTSFDNDRFLEYFPADYPAFPGIDPAASRAMFNALPAANVTVDREGDSEAYAATERVYAGYVMTELFAGPRLTIVPGVRVEATRVDYRGNEVQFDASGAYQATVPVTGGRTETRVLPGVHLRYAMDDATNLRVAYTRTLARPNYFDLVPYQLVFQDGNEIQRGNSNLRSTTSNNLDILVERYFRSVGVVSGGVFYKRLNDYIYAFQFQDTAFGDLYKITQPLNGQSASLVGLELAFQNQLRFLPAPFDGIGVYTNYTWTDSTARFPDRAEPATLPGQSRHLGNFAVWYEKFGLSAKVAWNVHGRYIDAVGITPDEDVYYDDHVQLDVHLSQRLGKNIRAYADFLNLRNAPLRYYIGESNRPIQEEYYRSWSTFGLKYNW